MSILFLPNFTCLPKYHAKKAQAHKDHTGNHGERQGPKGFEFHNIMLVIPEETTLPSGYLT